MKMTKKILLASTLLGITALFAADPATTIKTKCAVCHGQKMEKKALNKSDIVNKMTAKQIEDALKGYKAGTLNEHGLGATMKGQAAALDDAAITAIAKYITTELNK